MSATIRIKRRAAGGAAGAPATLASAEIAFNEQDNTLYYGKGDNGGGVATTVVAIAGPGTFPSTSTNNTWGGTNVFNGTVELDGVTNVTGTIDFDTAIIQHLPLSKLTDVNIGKNIALANGQMIAWDGIEWINIPAPSGGGGGTLTSVSATAGSGVSANTVGGAVTVAGIDATTTAKGVVQLADSAAISGGTVGRIVDAAQLKASQYALPTASGTTLGGIKVGSNLSIDGSGVLSATVPGALLYKGDVNVTTTAPAAVNGDVYHNSVQGVADPTWTGLTGTIQNDALLIYNGTSWSTADLLHTHVASISPSAPITVDNTNPSQPIIGVNQASVGGLGVVTRADAGSISAGTSGPVVDAAQLKQVIDRLPNGNTADDMLKWDATNTKWVVTNSIDGGVF